MLRRKPTAITVTSEDLSAFEDARLHQNDRTMENDNPDASSTAVNNNNNKSPGVKSIDPNDELKPLPGDKARIVRSREERMGITQRG
jgi:anaphase-promoting complex subunit CDC26